MNGTIRAIPTTAASLLMKINFDERHSLTQKHDSHLVLKALQNVGIGAIPITRLRLLKLTVRHRVMKLLSNRKSGSHCKYINHMLP